MEVWRLWTLHASRIQRWCSRRTDLLIHLPGPSAVCNWLLMEEDQQIHATVWNNPQPSLLNLTETKILIFVKSTRWSSVVEKKYQPAFAQYKLKLIMQHSPFDIYCLAFMCRHLFRFSDVVIYERNGIQQDVTVPTNGVNADNFSVIYRIASLRTKKILFLLRLLHVTVCVASTVACTISCICVTGKPII